MEEEGAVLFLGVLAHFSLVQSQILGIFFHGLLFAILSSSFIHWVNMYLAPFCKLCSRHRRYSREQNSNSLRSELWNPSREQTLKEDIIRQRAPRRKRKQGRGRRDASRGLFSAMVREADGLGWNLNQDLNEERERVMWGAGRERVRQKNSQCKGSEARVAW